MRFNRVLHAILVLVRFRRSESPEGIGVFLLWVVVLAIVLLRANRGQGSIAASDA